VRTFFIVLLGFFCPAMSDADMTASAKQSTVADTKTVREFIADHTYNDYFQEAYNLWHTQDSLGGPIDLAKLRTVDELLAMLTSGQFAMTFSRPPSREEYMNALQVTALPDNPLRKIQLFSTTVCPHVVLYGDPPPTIIAQHEDSIWFVVNCTTCGTNCWDFPIDSGVYITSSLLERYPLKTLDSIT